MIATTNGRPIRFFGLLMAGWFATRLVSINADIALIEDEGAVRLARDGKALLKPAARIVAASETLVVPDAFAAEDVRRASAISIVSKKGRASPVTPARLSLDQRKEQVGGAASNAAPVMLDNSLRTDHAHSQAAAPVAVPAPLITMAPVVKARTRRWRGSAWVLWRDANPARADVVTGGRLGGSQAGLRVDFDLAPQAQGRMAAYGRMSVAMNRPASPEAAIGLAWQPSRSVPISFAAERRIALGEGARNANALLMVGGFGPKRIIASLEAEAYAQTGMVGFRSKDAFVDGKMSLTAPLSRSPFRIGASISGGAQPGVERLDIGPELQIRLPLPHVASRISVEWRERIAGLATPASGFAVTLGGDF